MQTAPVTANQPDDPEALAAKARAEAKAAKAAVRALRRREKEEAMRSLGLVKVRVNGETLWE